MAKASYHFSGEHQSLAAIADMYQVNKAAIYHYKEYVLRLSTTNAPVPAIFFSMSESEVNVSFDSLIKELEHSFSLSAITSIEACFRMDYLNRVTERRKDNLSRAFKALHNKFGTRVHLENDILALWKSHLSHPMQKHRISTFIQMLPYRNWLAHGRYWVQKTGQIYDFEIVYSLCRDIKAVCRFND